MKKSIILAVVALISTVTFAQKGSGFGIKAGVNYNENGNLITTVGDAAADIVAGAEGRIGYHVGVFGKLKFPRGYFRPELQYTATQSTYMLDGSEVAYDITKLDLPLLLGLKIVGPLHVFAGPALQYQLDNELEGFNLGEAERDFTIGLHAGLAVNLGPVGLDVRYERGFTENETNFISENITDVNGRIDSRPKQVIFAASFKF